MLTDSSKRSVFRSVSEDRWLIKIQSYSDDWSLRNSSRFEHRWGRIWTIPEESTKYKRTLRMSSDNEAVLKTAWRTNCLPVFKNSLAKYSTERLIGASLRQLPLVARPLVPVRHYAPPLADFTKTKVQNQQYSDHNSLPLFIAITPAAAEKLNSISLEDHDSNLALRVQVESGGCHGFQYHLKLTSMDTFQPEEDSVFVRDGARVIVDKTSLEILRDSKIDYVHELIGSQFKVVDSPFTKSSCGCGSSFDFDFDKLNQST
ncbi:hypothetical protein OGAPHI_006514 [Ogataea philodendri]|uniref:Core domain-containing protein n=1 Tax=Ogataea philodendri TaxID=1378263 RepID=A0A9P8NZ15_9ASCO|nr:uncharacterized protein OGAPHI_006514 [Ogataea philodendri]KAH3661664.1 hypothetical protein OGAPHI_006514 [Ogataea philodendri]